MDDQIERQRTHLQRRKISAAIKVKTHQPKQILKEFKLFLQNQLIAFGGVDPAGADTVIRGRGIGQSGSHRGIGAGIRHDSPSIEGIGDQQRSEKEVGNSNVEAIRSCRISKSVASGPIPPPFLAAIITLDEEAEEESEEADPYRKKRSRMFVGLAHLLPFEKPERNAQSKVSSHVRRRSDGGHSDHNPELETTVHGKSEFYDVNDEVVTINKASEDVPVKSPIDQKTLDEINRFEILIKYDFLRKQQQKRY
ncbi:hypothetical protein DAPPUDRAFT_119347 [Daphnia pulex]|uniref:Uncharacterized protein n=1 Tax=Daphnia pulex TaxID=6669 RepID=E9HY99_DAPPU|nr:hypothetical protein DAPPUDRAFT_119347 [Daphnia pulex]|eukprot:EFX63283.1 hypothetical protein DAPPUDRAFT_119347 [Daphnia pulex]